MKKDKSNFADQIKIRAFIKDLPRRTNRDINASTLIRTFAVLPLHLAAHHWQEACREGYAQECGLEGLQMPRRMIVNKQLMCSRVLWRHWQTAVIYLALMVEDNLNYAAECELLGR
jgi:hypothetical protein